MGKVEFMSQDDDYLRTVKYGEVAMSQIKANKLPALPRNYEIWFSYAAGYNPALNDSINEILKKRGHITVEEIDWIYEQFGASSRKDATYHAVSEGFSGHINKVVNIIEEALGKTVHYNESLRDATEDLVDAHDSATVGRIVHTLLDMTRDVEYTNLSLSEQLEDSRSQIRELQERLEVVRYESLTDQLTTLANRKRFDRSIQEVVKIAKENNVPFSLLITDIDSFKIFNDTHGHQTGDQVLRLVAMTVKQNIKGKDIACRYGGEEFAIILPDTVVQDAVKIANHIREAVMGKELVKRSTGKNLGRITVSVGASMWREGDSAETLIARADKCLYAAKDAGRNLVKSELDSDIEFGEVA